MIGETGPIDNAFRFQNECARHKTLDLIGDLALSGVEFVGRVISFRGGHSLNGKVAERLAEMAAQQSTRGIPVDRLSSRLQPKGGIARDDFQASHKSNVTRMTRRNHEHHDRSDRRC